MIKLYGKNHLKKWNRKEKMLKTKPSKKRKRIEDLFVTHIFLIKKTLSGLEKTIINYINKNIKLASEFSYNSHNYEGRADQVRRTIIEKIFLSSLLPSVKKELVNYISSQDQIADKAESACDFIIIQKPEIPGKYSKHIFKLISNIRKGYNHLGKATKFYFTDFSRIQELTKSIDILKEYAENITEQLISELFKNDNMSLSQKIHLNQLILHITMIEDSIYDTSNLLDSHIVKRKP